MKSRFSIIGLAILAIIMAVSVSQCGGDGDVLVDGKLISDIVYIKSSSAETLLFGSALSLSTETNILVVGAPGSDEVYIFKQEGENWVQQYHIQAGNKEAGDYFGSNVSLSADGNTLAVGAPHEDSSAAGIDGNQADNSAFRAGAVYVFSRSGSDWAEQAYIKASNTDAGDSFGNAVSLSSDGNTLSVGSPREGSSATGIDGNQADNSAYGSGAVYVFSRSDSDWTQQAYVKASNTAAGDLFGSALSLSADGNTLAVGAIGEDSGATHIDGDQADNSMTEAGAVFIFNRSGTVWFQQAYVKANDTSGGDPYTYPDGNEFGYSLSLSADGKTLVVGAPGKEQSRGRAYEYIRVDNVWSFHSGGAASNGDGGLSDPNTYPHPPIYYSGDRFGEFVSVSADAKIVAVGAPEENSAATGIDGDQTDNTAWRSGAVYIYTLNDERYTPWIQQAYVKASNTAAGDLFGSALSLSADGNIWVVGAPKEDSSATGINGDQTDNSVPSSGAVYAY